VQKIEVLSIQRSRKIKGRIFELNWDGLKKFDNGIWLPTKGNYVKYLIANGGNKILDTKVQFEVEEITIGEKFKDSLFTLEGLNLPPSTEVIDRIKGIEYKLGEK